MVPIKSRLIASYVAILLYIAMYFGKSILDHANVHCNILNTYFMQYRQSINQFEACYHVVM